jgi:hypothetical protein
MPDAPMAAIKRITLMDLGQKRKNYKYRVKKGLNIQDSIHATPNIEIFDAEDIKTTINTWLTMEDKVNISTNVTNY